MADAKKDPCAALLATPTASPAWEKLGEPLHLSTPTSRRSVHGDDDLDADTGENVSDVPPWDMTVKNTFVHIQSPAKVLCVSSPPRTVPSNWRAPDEIVGLDSNSLFALDKLPRTPATRVDSAPFFGLDRPPCTPGINTPAVTHAMTPSTAGGFLAGPLGSPVRGRHPPQAQPPQNHLAPSVIRLSDHIPGPGGPPPQPQNCPPPIGAPRMPQVPPMPWLSGSLGVGESQTQVEPRCCDSCVGQTWLSGSLGVGGDLHDTRQSTTSGPLFGSLFAQSAPPPCSAGNSVGVSAVPGSGRLSAVGSSTGPPTAHLSVGASLSGSCGCGGSLGVPADICSQLLSLSSSLAPSSSATIPVSLATESMPALPFGGMQLRHMHQDQVPPLGGFNGWFMPPTYGGADPSSGLGNSFGTYPCGTGDTQACGFSAFCHATNVGGHIGTCGSLPPVMSLSAEHFPAPGAQQLSLSAQLGCGHR